MKISRTFEAPVYVTLLYVAAWGCIAVGVLCIIIGLSGQETLRFGVGCLAAALINFFYAAIARDIGLTAWRTAILVQDLGPAIEQIATLHSSQSPDRAPLPLPTENTIAQEKAPSGYFITIDGKSGGPFSIEQLKEMYAKGRVSLKHHTRLPDGTVGPTVDELLAI